jgi:Secretion system C-terminal sorting domain
VLDIGIFNAVSVNLYKAGIQVQNSSSQGILKVGLLNPLSGSARIGFTSTVEFDEIQMVFDAGLISASLGGTYNIYYAFVRRDDDNDGIPDLLETCGTQDDAIDANGNGVPDACEVLPIKLLSFDAKLNGRLVNINWNTAEEEGIIGFEVERLDSAGKFVSIANVDATNGGKQNKTYHLTDAKLPNAEKLYYRLKVNDKDGKISYSEVAMVLNKLSSVEERYVISPNPVTGNEIYLQTNIKDIRKLEIAIYDMSGAKKITNTLNIVDGFSRIPINVSNIGTGNYILTIKEGVKSYSLKFIKK